MSKPRLISFYLPQFYPTKENDEWWGNGFTEWTNVKRAKPLFEGHEQPRIPGELGYYDLRDTDIRVKQAQMARNAGIEGFCYWHYWFAGRRLLDTVFSEVVSSGKPDYPFCLCWANHSWYKKTWDPTKPDTLLIEQTYPGHEDFVSHFKAMISAFKDPRYMRVNGKLIFGIYDPMDVTNFAEMKMIWNKMAEEYGLEGFYFFGFTYDSQKVKTILDAGYDCVVVDSIISALKGKDIFYSIFSKVKRKIEGKKSLLHYLKYMKSVLEENYSEVVHPCILPNFDHSPRSQDKGIIITDHSPQKWQELCEKLFCKMRHRTNNLIFIKAWNEWGEGNYLEPDETYGRGFLEALRRVLENERQKDYNSKA